MSESEEASESDVLYKSLGLTNDEVRAIGQFCTKELHKPNATKATVIRAIDRKFEGNQKVFALFAFGFNTGRKEFIVNLVRRGLK